MPGKIINWMNAISLVTVPKITIILRKSYGQAYINMGGGRNTDEIACWPTADLGFMDPRVSVNVLYGVKEEDDPERFKAARRRSRARHHPVGARAAVRGAVRARPARHAELADPRARRAPPAA